VITGGVPVGFGKSLNFKYDAGPRATDVKVSIQNFGPAA